MAEQEQEGPRKEPRISNLSAGLMIGTAMICDLLGPFGAVGGPVVFFIWFKVKKVPIIGPKQLGKQLANLGLNALGEAFTAGVWAGVTVGVIITIGLSRAEDKFGISLDAKSLADPTKLAEKIKDGAGGDGQVKRGSAEGKRVVNDNEPIAERVTMNDIKNPATTSAAGASKPAAAGTKISLPKSQAA